MLAAAFAAGVARPPQAQQQHALVTKESKHSLLCVSTAVNLKTATCNSDCNNGRACPEVLTRQHQHQHQHLLHLQHQHNSTATATTSTAAAAASAASLLLHLHLLHLHLLHLLHQACFCMEHTYFMPPEEDDLALSMSGNGELTRTLTPTLTLTLTPTLTLTRSGAGFRRASQHPRLGPPHLAPPRAGSCGHAQGVLEPQ